MAIKESIVYSGSLELDQNNSETNSQSNNQLEKIILDFLNNPSNIPRRRYIIAHNQILSLYRRMKFHPEKILLCQFYENQILKIIQVEKGKVK